MSIHVEQAGLFREFDHSGELSFQRLLVRVAAELWPDFHLTLWSPPIRSRYGQICKPDCLFWRKGTRDWYVVEVELAHHSTSHIGAQFGKLFDGIYDLSVAPSLATALSISKEEAQSLVAARPGFLAIFDNHRDDAVRTAKLNGFLTAIITPYMSISGRAALHLKHVPSELTVQQELSRIHIEVLAGIGGRPTIGMPTGVPCPDGKVIVYTPTGTVITCMSHSRKIRGSELFLRTTVPHYATILGTTPFTIKLTEMDA